MRSIQKRSHLFLRLDDNISKVVREEKSECPALKAGKIGGIEQCRLEAAWSLIEA